MLEIISRKIIHIDMDCFYAAVEMRDNPSLKNRPVAVGGSKDQRGVLCTCNYVARKYGLHSAMATAHAFKLCPNLELLPVNMSKYRKVSSAIYNIFKHYSSNIEPLSLDEAFLDVTDCTMHQGSATWIAKAIRSQIKEEQGLTASAGVASNKFLAKIASEWCKPDGLFVITPKEMPNFIQALPVQKIFGVGPVSARKLINMGMKTCGDLQRMSLIDLLTDFGSMGARLYKLCRGIDDREVESNRQRKSISVEETYPEDLLKDEALEKLVPLWVRLQRRVERAKEDFSISKIFLKIKFYDFTRTTVETAISGEIEQDLYKKLFLEGYSRHNKPIRLLGLGVRLQPVKVSAQLVLYGLG